jgi:hypothetical protein
MNKYAIAALLGSVSAEEFLMATDKCITASETRMENIEFFRQMTQGAWKSFVKGFYHADKDLVSDDCLGEWIVPTIETLNSTVYMA